MRQKGPQITEMMMYKDKDKAREAARERVRRYRARQKGVTPEPEGQGVTDDYSMLPELPVDELITANAGIGWPDVMALDREVVDEVYRVSSYVGDDVLLRLVRAAGYAKRTGRRSRLEASYALQR